MGKYITNKLPSYTIAALLSWLAALESLSSGSHEQYTVDISIAVAAAVAAAKRPNKTYSKGYAYTHRYGGQPLAVAL